MKGKEWTHLQASGEQRGQQRLREDEGGRRSAPCHHPLGRPPIRPCLVPNRTLVHVNYVKYVKYVLHVITILVGRHQTQSGPGYTLVQSTLDIWNSLQPECPDHRSEYFCPYTKPSIIGKSLQPGRLHCAGGHSSH